VVRPAAASNSSNRGDSDRPAVARGSANEKRSRKDRMTQEEVRKAAEGKTPREVLKALGKPDSTSDTPDDLDAADYKGTWYYWPYPVPLLGPAKGRDNRRRPV
jgi:hypothetical protein